MQSSVATTDYWLHHQRGHEAGKSFEWYRCYDARQNLRFDAHATRLGKPLPVFVDGIEVVHIANRSGYLVNGRTDIHSLANNTLLGSYTRLGRVYDGHDEKRGRWRDVRKWTEELKENLIDGVANALLGGGDTPIGANPGDVHVFGSGSDIIATLSRERLDFFPDPPPSMEPARWAKLASRIIPGELGRSLGEVTPPRGWKLRVQETRIDPELVLYSALIHIEFLRWSRQG